MPSRPVPRGAVDTLRYAQKDEGRKAEIRGTSSQDAGTATPETRGREDRREEESREADTA